MQAINPEPRELQQQVAEVRERLALQEGEIKQLNLVARDTSKQTIWQFIAFTASIGGLILGLLNYQNSVIRGEFESMRQEMNTRFEASKNTQAEFEKHINQRLDGVEKRIDIMDKNIADLKRR
jgi:hypothetical protein